MPFTPLIVLNIRACVKGSENIKAFYQRANTQAGVTRMAYQTDHHRRTGRLNCRKKALIRWRVGCKRVWKLGRDGALRIWWITVEQQEKSLGNKLCVSVRGID